jgi:hypothetical protein
VGGGIGRRGRKGHFQADVFEFGFDSIHRVGSSDQNVLDILQGHHHHGPADFGLRLIFHPPETFVQPSENLKNE